MPIIICPGIHDPQLTEQFIFGIQDILGEQKYLVLPTDRYLPYSAVDVYRWLQQQKLSSLEKRSLFFITFSAGVVGGIGAAIAWQLAGRKVCGFVAIDGWGMPLAGNFPIYRLSHDRFTHWSSAILGGSAEFYADPPQAHLELWRSPQSIHGWRQISPGLQTRDYLLDYLQRLLAQDMP